MTDTPAQPPQRTPRQGNLIIPPSRDDEDDFPVRRPRAKQEAPKPAGWLAYLMLILSTIGCYSPLFNSDLLWSSYDEVERSAYESMDSLSEVWTYETIRTEDPLTLSSYFLEQRLPFAPAVTHHAINIGLHVLAALLLLKTLDALKLPAAFSAALVFALHPSVLQTIFWSGYRSELIALIVLLWALYLGVRNRSPRDFVLMTMCSTVAFIIHPATLVLPLVLALCIFYQNTSTHLKDYNRVLPLLCLALFIGVWTRSVQAEAVEVNLGEQLALYAENLFFFLRQSLFPFELALFHPFDTSQGYNVGSQQSFLPFLLFIPFYILIALNYKKNWSRGFHLGLSSYLLLVMYGIAQKGAFLDGSLAHEDSPQYLALPFLLALVICSAGGIARNMGSGGKILWYMGFSLFALGQMTVTASYAYSVSERSQMWMTLSEQWPDSWIPKLALIQSIQESGEESELLSKPDMIEMLEKILEQQPGLIEERRLLARIFRDEGQNTNALRQYKRILRDSEPDDAFLEEAATFYDSLGLSWDASNARERKSGPTP